ncbi:uncharacterized protein LOC125464833 [Stegostoma tigrinum]|uniref:uncharacterized protein LOC125464833 n=1 Tax=Stegostoma tigrinum TaxID=3053191 RepID=UPI00202AEDB1|nr:uncharacterized protein LOC125464833 [Stegostoma tigrinum]
MAGLNPRVLSPQGSVDSLDSGYLSADLGDFLLRFSAPVTEGLRQVYGPQGDKRPFLQQLEVRNAEKYPMISEWTGIQDTLCQSELDLVVEKAKTLIQVNNEYYSCIRHNQFQEIYKHLLQVDQEIGSLLAYSLKAAGTMDLTKVDLDLFDSLISVHPLFPASLKDMTSQHGQQELREFSQKICWMLGQKSLDDISGQIKQDLAWCAREFLHAVLLSLKRPQDLQNTFSLFQGKKILLPINIDPRWSKDFKKVMLLVHKHTSFKETETMMWFGPTLVDAFLKMCSCFGYPHISREMSRNKPERNVVRFTQQPGKQDKGVHELDVDFSPSIFLTQTLEHVQHSELIKKQETVKHPSSMDAWLFRMAGALASEWRAVTKDLGFNNSDIEQTALDPWYNHQQRMFHFLKRLMGEKCVKFTELCFLLLCKSKEYKCCKVLGQIVGSALAADTVSTLEPIQDAASNWDQIHLQERSKEPVQQNRYQHVATMQCGDLRLIYNGSNGAPTVNEIHVKEFENFLGQVSLAGPPFNVHTPSTDTQLLLLLPKCPSCSVTGMDINAELKKNLALFLIGKYPGQKIHLKSVLFRKFQQLLSEEEQKLLHTYLVLEDAGAIVNLTVTKGKQHLHLLWDVMQECGALIRAWPTRYQDLLQNMRIRVAHIRDGNLELFVPQADSGSHVWILLRSHSPVAVVEKLWNYFTDCEAYCLLYKPVGRLYIKNKIKMYAYLIPNCDTLVQALNREHDSYKQVFKTKLLVHKNASYKLQFRNTNVTKVVSITPADAAVFKHSLCPHESKTKYILQLDGHFDDWPLVFQLVQEDKSCVVLNELITEEQLRHENEEYILVTVNGKRYCILRIHSHITYQQFASEMEETFPGKTFNIYYKQKGNAPLLINGQNSIEYLLKQCETGDIILQAEEKSHCSSLRQSSEEEEPTLSELKEKAFSQLGSFKSSRIPHSQGRTQIVGTPKHFLQKNKLALITRLTEIHCIIEELKTKDILNETEYEKLLTAKHLSDQNRETLNYVIKKGTVAMNYFCDLLHRYHPLLVKDIESNE